MQNTCWKIFGSHAFVLALQKMKRSEYFEA